MLFILKGMLP